LHHAYIQKQDIIINLLLENGSFTRKVDAFGKIPSDYKNSTEEKNTKNTQVLNSNSSVLFDVNLQNNEIKIIILSLIFIYI